MNPCANCGHDRRQHWHYPGAGLRPGGHGKCLLRECPCERYVAEAVEFERALGADVVVDTGIRPGPLLAGDTPTGRPQP